MRIQDFLSEAGTMGVGQTIAGATGNTGASMGQMMKTAALKGLGLGNTADAFQQKHAIGAFSGQNASELVKALGIKQGMDFQLGPSQKVKITKVDNTGATFIDPATKLPTTLGVDGLSGILQRQQAVQQVAQMQQQQKPKPGASSAPTAPAGV
jgi:hypothetical protein